VRSEWRRHDPTVRHAFAWLLALVLAAAGTLVGHAAAYRLTGQPAGEVHAYLDHAPQVLFVLATVAVALLAVTRAAAAPPAWPFPVLALTAFAVQEHVERLVHTGHVPWLLTNPTFLTGLAVQLPLALAAWALARRLLRVLGLSPRRPRLLPAFQLALATDAPTAVPGRRPPAPTARAPPQLLRPC
jgi:hypothetical protein